jgi:hypothetical protein
VATLPKKTGGLPGKVISRKKRQNKKGKRNLPKEVQPKNPKDQGPRVLTKPHIILKVLRQAARANILENPAKPTIRTQTKTLNFSKYPPIMDNTTKRKIYKSPVAYFNRERQNWEVPDLELIQSRIFDENPKNRDKIYTDSILDIDFSTTEDDHKMERFQEHQLSKDTYLLIHEYVQNLSIREKYYIDFDYRRDLPEDYVYKIKDRELFLRVLHEIEEREKKQFENNCKYTSHRMTKKNQFSLTEINDLTVARETTPRGPPKLHNNPLARTINNG